MNISQHTEYNRIAAKFDFFEIAEITPKSSLYNYYKSSNKGSISR